MKTEWLQEAIITYIKTHKHVDSPELVSHFQLRADIVLSALFQLYDDRVERYWNGKFYELRVLTDQKQ